jgi:TPR repeat protein
MRIGLRSVALSGAMVLLYILAVGVFTGGMSSIAQAQQENTRPMTLDGLLAALRKGKGVLPPSEYIHTIQKRGVSFEVTAGTERQLRQAGATSEIVQAARANYRGIRVQPQPHPAPAHEQSSASADALYDQKRYEEAAPLYERSCRKGEAGDCNRLGYMYDMGQGVAKDDSQAAPYFTKACDGGFAMGCDNLGLLYYKGQGVTQDYFKAATLYQKACNNNRASGCRSLGLLYEDGQGVAKDILRANALYLQACDAGDANGCSFIGENYGQGLGVATDIEKARQYLSKGCSGGHQWGCDHLKTLNERLIAEQAAREKKEKEEQRERERQAEEARKREADQRNVQSAQDFSDRYESWLKTRQAEMAPNVITVVLKNECATDSIRVAMRFQVPDSSGRWVTSGWWSIKSGESGRPTIATATRDVYFFAEGATHTWNGDGKSDSISVPVVTNNFVHQDGDKLVGINQKTVTMFHSVFGTWGEHSQSFTCE